MFESAGYAFKLLTVAHPYDELPLIKKHVYEFRTKHKRRYLVELHEYEYKVFVIKFHDARHKNLPSRYGLLTKDNDCQKVLRTVVDIAKHTLTIEPLASFAFKGVPVEGKEDKDQPRSQRHRVYKTISENLLGIETFLHGYEERSSCYLLVNKANEDPEQLYSTIVDMFVNEFQGIEGV